MKQIFTRYVCARCGRGTDTGVVINERKNLAMGPTCARKAGLIEPRSRRAPASVALRVECAGQGELF